MSKKKLDVSTITNELRGQSVYFPQKQEEEVIKPEAPLSPPAQPISDSLQASKHSSNLASKHASTLALSTEMIEFIRKIVKNPGKEDVLYIRLTKEEKDKLADVSYTYKRQGMKTSDNEVVRIAINALLEDYKANGETSLLATILASLHA